MQSTYSSYIIRFTWLHVKSDKRITVPLKGILIVCSSCVCDKIWTKLKASRSTGTKKKTTKSYRKLIWQKVWNKNKSNVVRSATADNETTISLGFSRWLPSQRVWKERGTSFKKVTEVPLPWTETVAAVGKQNIGVRSVKCKRKEWEWPQNKIGFTFTQKPDRLGHHHKKDFFCFPSPFFFLMSLLFWFDSNEENFIQFLFFSLSCRAYVEALSHHDDEEKWFINSLLHSLLHLRSEKSRKNYCLQDENLRRRFPSKFIWFLRKFYVSTILNAQSSDEKWWTFDILLRMLTRALSIELKVLTRERVKIFVKSLFV